MILDDVKTILGIDTSLQDNLLSIYIRKSKKLILNYLKITKVEMDEYGIEEIDIAEERYPDAVIEHVILTMNKRGNEGLKAYGQGGVSGTYGDDMPDSVKDLLPQPFLRMR